MHEGLVNKWYHPLSSMYRNVCIMNKHATMPVACAMQQRMLLMCSILTKGSTCRKNKKNEIFVDLNRAGHDKSVEKKLAF